MLEFTFTASAECDLCGAWLSSSDEECDNCDPSTVSRYHFTRVGGDELVTVWALNPVRAWAELRECVDDPIPWMLEERGYTSLHYKQMGYDVTDEEALRGVARKELNSRIPKYGV